MEGINRYCTKESFRLEGITIRCLENNFFGITEELVQQLLNTEQ